MQTGRKQRQTLQNEDGQPAARGAHLRLAVGIALLTALVLVTGAAQSGPQNPDKPMALAQASRPPDANDQMVTRENEKQQEDFAAANTERKKELAEESDMLLTLAMALKAEVDKTNKDTLSLNVIRKADEIEKLAHNVKEKMKLTAGGS